VLSTAAALLSLFETFVTILVVNLAGFRHGECLVSFSDFDEFLFGSFVTSRNIWLVYIGTH